MNPLGQKWKKTCCLPSFVLFGLTLGCLITGVALLSIFKVGVFSSLKKRLCRRILFILCWSEIALQEESLPSMCQSFSPTFYLVPQVDPRNLTINAVLIAMASVVGLALLLNCKTWWQVADSVLNSQRKRLHSAANNLHRLKSEGFMKVI